MADRVGQQVGNYRLMRLLGQGGFAEVYLGEHIHLETEAAIKLLHTYLVGKDKEAFRKEARTIARLVHPNIVRVFDFGIENDTPFLVMDYAPNGTLRSRHPKGVELPLPTILDYVRQIATALQYAHDEHLVHCDIKPENLLMGRRQEILLTDFGIARITQASRGQSMQNVAGTASYMAPEQFQGKPDAASDQYALAIMVYEWLTGTCPFQGTIAALAGQHLLTPPPPLLRKTSTLSPEVVQVVMTALAKDPKQRFDSVIAFATALQEAADSTSPQKQFSIYKPTIAADAPPLAKQITESLIPTKQARFPRSFPPPMKQIISLPRLSLISIDIYNTAPNQQAVHSQFPYSGRKHLHLHRIAGIFLLITSLIGEGFLLINSGVFAGHSTTPTSTAVTNFNTPTPTVALTPTPTVMISLGCPGLSMPNATDKPNGTQTYTVSIQAKDQTGGNCNLLQEKPITADGITCRTWLVSQDNDPSADLANDTDQLQHTDTFNQPFPHEIPDAFIFDPPTTNETQPCVKGAAQWKFTISPSVPKGNYWLIGLTDWQGQHWNWTSRQITVR